MVLLTFDMTHAALAAEAALIRADIRAVLAPTPTEISAGCGFCLRVAAADRPSAEAVLRDAGIAVAAALEQPER